jgi:hypothetical protein
MLCESLGVLQDIKFTGKMDPALKWIIKEKNLCIDTLQKLEGMAARLLKIKDAVINETNEDVAEFRNQCSTSDNGENAASCVDEESVDVKPTKYSKEEMEQEALKAHYHVELVVEPWNDAAVLVGSEADVLALLDPDFLPDAGTWPEHRKPVLPDGILVRLLRGSKELHCGFDKDDRYILPLPGDIFMLTDGKRDYFNASTLATIPSELILRARKTRVCSGEALPQQVTMFCLSATLMVPDIIPERWHSVVS